VIVSSDDELGKLREIGKICANTIQVMAKAMEPGMTTRELDGIGKTVPRVSRGAIGTRILL
jgi:methionyl aminopeptidase